VNGLIPEVVDRIDYRKGPYHADLGDFSLAGAALMHTVDTIDPFIGVEAGEYGWARVAGGGTFDVGAGTLALAGQWKTYDGPWELEEDLEHESVWAKYSQPTAWGDLEVTATGYHADWLPSEQIPERAIGTSVCEDEFCALDPTARGETWRWTTGARLLGETWRATAYFQYYDWHMLSNPTYDYQINQLDERWIAGGRYERDFTLSPSFELTAGLEGRYDDISGVGLDHTQDGVFVEPIARHSAKEGSVGVYAEGTWSPVDRLRVIGGLRGDWYDFDVSAKLPGLDEGDKSTDQISPKIAVAYEVSDNIELYGNWGRGFHSNDARGVVNAQTPVPGLVEGTGYEGGARFEVGDFKITTTYWWLNLDSELKFVGDSNSVEPGAGSERRGYEIVAFWRPIDWLALDAVWTGSHARFEDSPGAEYIPGAVENAGEFGISAVQDRWEAAVRVRHLGKYPLIEDNSQRAGAETLVNVRGAWHWRRITLYGEVLNIFDSDGKDIVYYYASNVTGLDPPGVQVDGRMSRVAEPRTVRVGIKYNF
jgi:outer membrane receptor protein involved in Fe transport